VTISPEKIILQREKERCAIFIRAHFMWGLQIRLGLSWGVSQFSRLNTKHVSCGFSLPQVHCTRFGEGVMHTVVNQRAAMQCMRHCNVKKSRLMQLWTGRKFSTCPHCRKWFWERS